MAEVRKSYRIMKVIILKSIVAVLKIKDYYPNCIMSKLCLWSGYSRKYKVLLIKIRKIISGGHDRSDGKIEPVQEL